MRSQLFYLAFVVATFCGMLSTHAASPASIQLGRGLFERQWAAKDPRLGGDGLGPMFNGKSCVACHNQGGTGGGGAAEFNANTVGIESIHIKGSGVNNDVIATMVSAFHPGFVQSDGSVVNTFTIPHRGGSSAFRQLSDTLYQHVPTIRSESGGSANASEVRHSYATPILFNHKIGPHEITLRARLFQRNTTSLFGAGAIDAVADKDILAQARLQKSHPEISGRPSTLNNGMIGKFGWRGNVASLLDFVDQACANELGLETRRKPQSRDPLNRGYRNPAVDISDAQVRAMGDFIAALPSPGRDIPVTNDDRVDVVRGEQIFHSVGCSVCHVPDLGVAKGIYSDLLLHDMGTELIDLNHAEPYVIRRTPMVSHKYSQTLTTEKSAGAIAMGVYYGSTTVINANFTSTTNAPRSPRKRGRSLQTNHDYNFVAPKYPSKRIDIIDVAYEDLGVESSSKILEDGRLQISEEQSAIHAYIRVHYEPTNFNQEWRTPPLWGIADTAPYMHDGRAETLLESITMHDGESARTRDRFLNLSLADRHALIAFLETLVSPANAPQPQS